jgi:hypothetical protein
MLNDMGKNSGVKHKDLYSSIRRLFREDIKSAVNISSIN